MTEEQSIDSIGESQDKSSSMHRDDIDQIMVGTHSRTQHLVTMERKEDEALLESKGFGLKDDGKFQLRDYEVLYLMYTKKLRILENKKDIPFQDYVDIASKRDKEAWSRFLIFRDLRSRGYVVREGFGFPIDFRVYDRGDYGNKAAKFIVFGLNEGKTISILKLKEHIEQMSTMGKEAVVAVVERRGEVIYYRVGKWHPQKSL